MSAITYMRFSPRRNEETCDSIEKQQAKIKAYCHAKNYTIRAEFGDPAASGGDENRPGLWAALDVLEMGDVLVVWTYDRLARDVYLSEVIRRDVENKGCTIEAVEGGLNGDSPEERMIRQILAAFAEYQRKVIAIRTKLAMLRHQAGGRRMSDRTPYGTMRDPEDPKRLVPCAEELENIATIKKRHFQGVSCRGICRELEEAGRSCRGGPWHHSLISSIVKRSAK